MLKKVIMSGNILPHHVPGMGGDNPEGCHPPWNPEGCLPGPPLSPKVAVGKVFERRFAVEGEWRNGSPQRTSVSGWKMCYTLDPRQYKFDAFIYCEFEKMEKRKDLIRRFQSF